MSTDSNPLYLLAQAADKHASKPSSPSSQSRNSPCSPTSSLETPYISSIVSPLPRAVKSLARSNLPHNEPNFVPYVVRPKRESHKSELDTETRLQMKTRRKDLMDKATKIKSLENSPADERQLSVLRMIYDEITMYPCESWMVLVAIVIHRAYKQVKNWFSNERQKNRYGDSIPSETEEGDKVRLRPFALSMQTEWSDAFFEEVVMIYDYKVQRNSRPIRRTSRTSDQ